KDDAHDDHKDDEHDDHKDDEHDDHKDEEHDDQKEDKHDDHQHDEYEQSSEKNEHGHEEHEEDVFVKMSLAQQKMAGIKIEKIFPQKQVKQTLSVPGEVVNDLYNTTLLTTQVDSKVISRQVVLGQHVKKDDLIAILYSLNIANAQNQLKVSTSEWQRVKTLGKKTVGEKRYIASKAEFDKNKSTLIAYGFNEKLIQDFLSGKSTFQSGQYPVIAPHNGVILEDNFQSGQFLSMGSTIALLVNEDQVWIEALLAPEIGQRIPVDTKAKVTIDNKVFTAKVIHDSHAIDEVTRTRKIRLLLENKEHLLHSGLFATVYLELPVAGNVILLPETALMRSSDGDWTVFIEQEKGVFKQEEVKLKNTINGLHHIGGLKAGQRVATKGAFFLASEMAKGGFDPHNH
ncbi:MAG: efflux RND transporter periplasmic adaptor subunit, partial [Gammaproteobacteria bacterium]|nr:efflux RND transporter periplasmic adaptor subunit [Gammaproteobacteria bacterium]